MWQEHYNNQSDSKRKLSQELLYN